MQNYFFMKTRLFLFALLVFSFVTIHAKEKEAQLLQQLINVNAQWSKQPEAKYILSQVEIKNVRTFNDWIATHLMLAEQTLRSRNVSHLSTTQIKNRLELLDKLNGYWNAKTFPVNDYLTYKNPVFIDRVGTHCAVGYLMQQSGAEQLARQIDAEQKFAFVHEIKVPGVKEWADENGFTIDELAWIQPGYPPAIDAEDMKKGLDGIVNVIVVEETNQIVYAAGSFSKAVTTGVTCNNIAAWISGFAGYDWIPVGNGVNGTVHAMLLHNNKLYVGGEFTMADNMPAPHVAVYDIQSGQWQAMGNLDSTVRAFAVYNNEVYAGGDFTGMVSKWNGNAWQDIAQGFLYGEGVRTLEVWDNKLVIGGNFELATGALRKHVAAYDGMYMDILGFGTLTPVNDFEVHQNKLYAACDFTDGTDTCALAVFDTDNDVWDVDLAPSYSWTVLSYLMGNSFRHLKSRGSSLLIAGDFYAESGMIAGNNLMDASKAINPGDGNYYYVFSPLLTVDQPVNHLAVSGLNVYFGGDFITNAYTDTLNHIGYLQLTPVGINHQTVKNAFVKIFPNPVSDMVNIQSLSAGEKIIGYEITDAAGKMVMRENVNAATTNISIKHLSAGVYTIKISLRGKLETMKVVKN
jgi:hypothetical protein